MAGRASSGSSIRDHSVMVRCLISTSEFGRVGSPKVLAWEHTWQSMATALKSGRSASNGSLEDKNGHKARITASLEALKSIISVKQFHTMTVSNRSNSEKIMKVRAKFQKGTIPVYVSRSAKPHTGAWHPRV